MQDELLQRLQNIVDREPFYEAAESVLSGHDNPTFLARCAEIVGRREPGGAFYRAKLWAKANALLTENQNSRKTLGLLCVEAQADIRFVRQYAAQGQAIYHAEQLNNKAISSGGAVVDLSLLREAPALVFENALNQKDRSSEYLLGAAVVLESNIRSTAVAINNRWCDENGSIKANLDIIKPSDWWAFSHPKWRKDDDFDGSIPGEVYANALYYFAPTCGVAVDAMAGSGMLKRVYDDRQRWQKDLSFELDIHLFDIKPKRTWIQKHDARTKLPVVADWIFVDPPYFGQSKHLFDDSLAVTQSHSEYVALLKQVVEALHCSLNTGGRLCVFLPKWSGTLADDVNYDVPKDITDAALSTGFKWLDAAYVSRARQQEPGSALKNNSAKQLRRMRSDTCVLNVYEKV